MTKKLNLSLLCLIVLMVGCATQKVKYLPEHMTPVVYPMPERCEGFNRVMDDVSTGLARGIMLPVARGWEFIIPRYPRMWISNFNHTVIQYPVNVVSLLLGGDFGYAWQDTKRLGINLCYGYLGFWDAATEKGVPAVKGGFGRTFASWHIGEGNYVSFPLVGQHSVRQTTGNVVDFVLDPISYIIPSPASTITSITLAENDLSFAEPTIYQFFQTETMPYEMMRTYNAYKEKVLVSNYKYDQKSDKWDADQTLGVMAAKPQNPKMVHKGDDNTIKVTGLGKITYTCWPVENSKCLVVVLPGMAGHRLSNSVLVWAELLNRRGCSVLAISGPASPDYIKKIASERPAMFIPEDVKVLKRFVAAAVKDYQIEYNNGKPVECRILGSSQGGLNALFMAAGEEDGQLVEGLTIAKYLAINPPVDSLYALKKLDTYFSIPTKWEGNEEAKAERVRDICMRLIAMANPNNLNPPTRVFPLTREESQFLIGVAMRANLSYCLQAQEKKCPSGILKEDPTAYFHRNVLVDETLAFSFDDYVNKVIIPWYQQHGYPQLTKESAAAQCSLKAIEKQLAKNNRILVFQNENDPLLAPADVKWYTTTLGARATMFKEGGHLGNSANPDYQKQVLNALLK